MPVSFSGWIRGSLDHFINGDGAVLKRSIRPLYFLYVAGFLTYSHRYPLGTNIFDEDWDLLIILDACRTDALEIVANEYEFLDSIDSIWSVGSTSFEWMPQTFRQEYIDEIKRTAYITGNPYTQRVFKEKRHPPVRDSIPFGPTNYPVVDPDDFAFLDELWKYENESSFNRKPPRHTTDAAISAGRSIDADRYIVHYMYPHNPYPLADADLQKPFKKLRRGEVSRETVWNLYLDNLRYVLDDVALLLKNINSDTVIITADHGEAFGEYGFYKHDIACPLPSVRKVPWAKTSAIDTQTYHPDYSVECKESTTTTAENRLRDLGYL